MISTLVIMYSANDIILLNLRFIYFFNFWLMLHIMPWMRLPIDCQYILAMPTNGNGDNKNIIKVDQIIILQYQECTVIGLYSYILCTSLQT